MPLWISVHSQEDFTKDILPIVEKWVQDLLFWSTVKPLHQSPGRLHYWIHKLLHPIACHDSFILDMVQAVYFQWWAVKDALEVEITCQYDLLKLLTCQLLWWARVAVVTCTASCPTQGTYGGWSMSVAIQNVGVVQKTSRSMHPNSLGVMNMWNLHISGASRGLVIFLTLHFLTQLPLHLLYFILFPLVSSQERVYLIC